MEKPKLADAVIIKENNEKYVYMNPDIPNWIALHKEAAMALELCDGTRSVREIAEILAKEFNDPVDETEKAVTNLFEYAGRMGMFLEAAPKKFRQIFTQMKFMWLYATNKCNLRCRYCYLSAGDPLDDELSLEEIKRILDEFKALGEGTEQTLVLSGGEPLVREDIWEIAEYGKDLGLDFILSTNGLLADKDVAKKIKKYFRAVQVSLDGNKEMHDKYRGKGSFDGAVEGIANLVEAGITPSISATVTKENFKRIHDLWDVCEKYNLKSVKANPVMPMGKAEDKTDEMMLTKEEYVELWREVRRELKRRNLDITVDNDKSVFSGGNIFKASGFSCGAGNGSLSVDSNGDVYPCQAAHIPQFRCGNVREKSLDEIRKSSEVIKDWMCRSIYKIPECNACEWKMYCGGGCNIQAVPKHGTVHAPDMYCDVYKVEYEESLWDHVENLLKEEQG